MTKKLPKIYNQTTSHHNHQSSHILKSASQPTHKLLDRFKLTLLSLGLLTALGVTACQNQTVKTEEATPQTKANAETKAASAQSSNQTAAVKSTTAPAPAAQATKPTSLIVSNEYFDYTLPESVSKVCEKRGQCPEIKIEYLSTNQPWITDTVNAQINTMAFDNADISQDQQSEPTQKKISAAALKARLDQFAKSQLTELPEDSSLNYSLEVEPRYLGHMGDIELIELISYVYLGGAHGMPYTEYLLLDTQSQRRLSLNDLLIADQQPKFKALAYEAYKDWVKELDNEVKSHEEMWPFFLTENVSLNSKGVVLKYQAYDIGPYAYGQPELVIPYHKLKGIIQPQYQLSK